MSYIGNQPVYQSFLTDTFSGTGSQSAFTMTVAPPSANSILVTVGGVLQNPSAYGVNGNILTFTEPPPGGSNNIVVRFLALTASNVTTPAYRTITEITAISGQTTFSVGNYTPGFVNVFRNGVKLAAADYTATNGATVVLSTPCAIGDIVHVESFYVSSTQDAIPARGGVITPGYLDVGNASGSGAMLVPSGSNANRPVSPQFGMIRANSTLGAPEWWSSDLSSWIRFADAPYTLEYIIVAGGGAGGSDRGGGGGAGGYLTGSLSVISGTVYPVSIGGGGAGGANTFANGNNSTALGLTALAGGGGANNYGNPQNAGSGGSGGGGSNFRPTGGSGTAGQGNAGGTGGGSNSTAGGGGGAGSVGGSVSGSIAGSGGTGRSDTWTGSTRTIAGGGGGAAGAGGTAGTGQAGGGNGSTGDGNATAGSAAANTGSGGGGATGGGAAVSGSGGSGIVVIRYLGSQRATGGTITTVGGYTIHTFTSSGTFIA